VNFLLNMNILPELGPMLTAKGHTWRHASDIGLARASDVAILAEAKAQHEFVIMHDLDYRQMLAFSGDSTPSVIIFRLRRADADLMFERIKAAWHEIEEPLVAGAVVSIEDGARRVRRPPIAKEA
jgi:predicted nuclease of predicted toxin-antitoxin system